MDSLKQFTTLFQSSLTIVERQLDSLWKKARPLIQINLVFIESMEPSMSNITIKDSVVGQIMETNAGSMDNIDINITSLKNDNMEDIAQAFKYITESVVNSSVTHKSSVIEQIEELSSQANKPASQRSKGVITALFNAVAGSVSGIGGVVETWNKWGPVIRTFFGI